MSRGGSEGQKRSGGVNYGAVLDRRVDDARHERERAYKESIREKGASSLQEKPSAMSSTFDAFQRMAAGLEPRTLQDIMSNPNRPTWEEYKKENESKLDLVGTDMRKMAEYRAQLDRDREGMLSGGKRKASAAISDSEDEVGGKKKSKKKKEKKKKGKKKSSSKVCGNIERMFYAMCNGILLATLSEVEGQKEQSRQA